MRRLIENQVFGGITMGIGFGLKEERRLDRQTGRMVNGNTLDYKMPTALDVPPNVALSVSMPSSMARTGRRCSRHQWSRAASAAGGRPLPRSLPAKLCARSPENRRSARCALTCRALTPRVINPPTSRSIYCRRSIRPGAIARSATRRCAGARWLLWKNT